MTALSPIENSRVFGVAAEAYPLNTICAHPECSLPVEGAHHTFPRSKIKSKSYFVEIEFDNRALAEVAALASGVKAHVIEGSHTAAPEGGLQECWGITIPMTVGLCGSGTTGHHGDVEEHRAWIKLEDGEFVWYGRAEAPGGVVWLRVGALNPQPGSREGKTKRRKQATTPEERKASVTTTVKTPVGEENVIPELVDANREKHKDEAGWTDSVPAYFVIVHALVRDLQ